MGDGREGRGCDGRAQPAERDQGGDAAGCDEEATGGLGACGGVGLVCWYGCVGHNGLRFDFCLEGSLGWWELGGFLARPCCSVLPRSHPQTQLPTVWQGDCRCLFRFGSAARFVTVIAGLIVARVGAGVTGWRSCFDPGRVASLLSYAILVAMMMAQRASFISPITAETQVSLQHLVESMPIAVVIVDAGGHIVYVNEKLGEMFGYAPDELLGKLIEMLLPERFRHTHLHDRRRYVEHPHVRGMGLGMDLSGRRKDGSEFSLEAGLSTLQLTGEHYTVVTVTDITKRKQVEEMRAQIEHSAITAERNRIARDLHDAVTQTLFSASLIAGVLPTIWKRNQEEGMRQLEELRDLTRGALAEMRTLLLELRPAKLIEVDLGDLLRQLVEAISGRARIPITLEVEGDGEISADVKVALYRVAQEALNNIAKHSHAQHVWIRFERSSSRVLLAVKDDGNGFVFDKIAPHHLGLGIMRERADAIGGTLAIRSTPGKGTTIEICWTKADAKS